MLEVAKTGKPVNTGEAVTIAQAEFSIKSPEGEDICGNPNLPATDTVNGASLDELTLGSAPSN